MPERTVDSLLAIELTRHDPHVIVISPTNHRNSVDHLAISSKGILVFECKAVLAANPDGDWRAEVDLAQLAQYVAAPLPVYYLFLGKPAVPQQPSRRQCTCAGRPRRTCVRCCRDARTASNLEEHVRNASAELSLQPWFCHWAWVITAARLDEHLRSSHVSRINLSDRDMKAISGADRLCHFLAVEDRERTESRLASMADFAAWWSNVVGGSDSAEETSALTPVIALL